MDTEFYTCEHCEQDFTYRDDVICTYWGYICNKCHDNDLVYINQTVQLVTKYGQLACGGIIPEGFYNADRIEGDTAGMYYIKTSDCTFICEPKQFEMLLKSNIIEYLLK